MTELSFLVDLLLNHKLAKATREAVAARIKEVETRMASQQQMPAPAQVRNTFEVRGIQAPAVPAHLQGQSASTIAAMMRQEANGTPVAPLVPMPEPIVDPATPPMAAVPVTIIAQTPATAAALADRQNAIAQQISGKPEKGRTSPRKF